MEEELTIVMEPLIDDREIVVTVTKEAQSLNPLILPSDTKFEDLRRKVSTRYVYIYIYIYTCPAIVLFALLTWLNQLINIIH